VFELDAAHRALRWSPLRRRDADAVSELAVRINLAARVYRHARSLARDVADTQVRDGRLASATRDLADATDRVRTLVPPDIQLQHRKFLKVHLRGGEPCPRCGRTLRQIGGEEATTFCRTCQPPF